MRGLAIRWWRGCSVVRRHFPCLRIANPSSLQMASLFTSTLSQSVRCDRTQCTEINQTQKRKSSERTQSGKPQPITKRSEERLTQQHLSSSLRSRHLSSPGMTPDAIPQRLTRAPQIDSGDTEEISATTIQSAFVVACNGARRQQQVGGGGSQFRRVLLSSDLGGRSGKSRNSHAFDQFKTLVCGLGVLL